MNKSNNPVFSIVIPTYGRSRLLSNCLLSISNLSYPPEKFEVIVVDDGSHAPPTKIVEDYKKSLNIELIHQDHKGPAAARNLGVSASKGQYLAFTDDDCTVQANWLYTFEKRLAKNNNCIIAGRVLNALPSNIYSTASQLLVDYLSSYFKNGNHTTFLTSNNMCLSRELFDRLGGFDESFPRAAAEDREFCDRSIHEGYKVRYEPLAIVNHYHYLTLNRFYRQHYNYGRGAYHFHKIRSKRTNEPIKIEHRFFYSKLLLYPFSVSAPSKYTLSALMFLTQFAHTIGFFRSKFLPEK